MLVAQMAALRPAVHSVELEKRLHEQLKALYKS